MHFSVTNSLPPGLDRRFEHLHPALAGPAPPGGAAGLGLADTAPEGLGGGPHPPLGARRVVLQLLVLGALTVRLAGRPG